MARCYFLLCFSNKYQQFLWLLHDPSDTNDISEAAAGDIGFGGFFSFPSDHSQRRSISLWG